MRYWLMPVVCVNAYFRVLPSFARNRYFNGTVGRIYGRDFELRHYQRPKRLARSIVRMGDCPATAGANNAAQIAGLINDSTVAIA
jgi:hypothetical protein